jgi:hypothetical protein
LHHITNLKAGCAARQTIVFIGIPGFRDNH